MNETDSDTATITLNSLASELGTRIRILLAWAAWADIAIVDTRTGAITVESADHLRILHAVDRSGPPEPEPAPIHTVIAYQPRLTFESEIAADEHHLNVS